MVVGVSLKKTRPARRVPKLSLVETVGTHASTVKKGEDAFNRPWVVKEEKSAPPDRYRKGEAGKGTGGLSRAQAEEKAGRRGIDEDL